MTEYINLVKEVIQTSVAKVIAPLQTAMDQLEKRQQHQSEALGTRKKILHRAERHICDESTELIRYNARQSGNLAAIDSDILTHVGPTSPAERLPTKEQRKDVRRVEFLKRMRP